MMRLLYIDKELTADRFKDQLKQTLIVCLMRERWSKDLSLFLPVKMDLPVEFGQPALAADSTTP